MTMVLRYLSNCVARAIEGPKHPLYCRNYDVDGELVPAMSFDDTSYDLTDPKKCLPVSEQIAAGMRLRPMGHAPSQSMLHDAMVADDFVKRFHAAGLPSAAACTVEEGEPAPAPAPSPAE